MGLCALRTTNHIASSQSQKRTTCEGDHRASYHKELGCSCWHNATHTLDLAKMAIHELPGFNLTWVAVCTLSHQYWHQSHRRYVTIILNSEVLTDVWMSGKENKVQPNVGDMIMNRIFWLVNISCIVEPNFMVCGCLFTSRIPYIIEVVSGSFPNPSWIIQLQVSIWSNHILAGSSHLESS